MPNLGLFDAFKGRFSLNKEVSDSADDMLKHAGVNFIKRKMLNALAIDFEMKFSEENDKIFVEECQFTTFVNKQIKFELGMDNEFTVYSPYFDDAFGIEVEKAIKYDASTNRIISHARSTGKHAGYDFTETRYVKDGNLYWDATLDLKGKKSANNRVFVSKQK
eukprot:CFRG1682T1